MKRTLKRGLKVPKIPYGEVMTQAKCREICSIKRVGDGIFLNQFCKETI